MNQIRPDGADNSKLASCKTIVWKIGPFVDGELPPSERDEVEAHLAACKDCVDMAVEFRKLDAAASRSKVPAVTGVEWASVWEGALAGGQAAADGKVLAFPWVSRMRTWMLPSLAAAAIFLAGAFFGTGVFTRIGPSPETGKQAPLASERRSDDSASKASSPTSETQVDDDVIIIDYPNF